MNKLLKLQYWLSIILISYDQFSFAQTDSTIVTIECTSLELFDQLIEAETCAKQVINNSTDSADITAAYSVLARVKDEYYNYDSTEYYLKKSLVFLPKSHRNRFLVFKEVAQFYYSYAVPDSSVKYYTLALSACPTTVDSIEVLFSLASETFFLDKFEEVDSLNKLTLKLLDPNDSLELAQYHLSYGLYYYDTKDFTNAIKYFATAREYYSKLKNDKKVAYVNFLMGDAFGTVNNYARAVELYKNALKIRRPLNSPEMLNTINSLGWSFWRINQLDSALHYINECLNLYETKAPTSVLKAYPLGNLGLIYNGLDSLDKARKASKDAIMLFDKMGYPIGKAEALNNIGKTYLKEQDFDKAKGYFESAKAILDTSWFDPLEYMNTLNGLSEVAYAKGDHEKAYQLLSHATQVKDSIFNLDIATALQVEEMNRALNLVQSNLQIVQKENDKKAADLRKSNFALAAFSGILVVLIISIIIITISWRQRQLALRMQNETLQINQEIIRMISHDFRGPMNNIRSLMEILKSEGLEKDEFDELSDTIYQQTCDISLMFESFVGWALSQSDNYIPKLDSTEWTENVHEVISLLEPLAKLKGVQINLEVSKNYVIQTDRIACQLILRNIISNAIKFSFENSAIQIKIFEKDNHVITQVIDFGVGMSKERKEEIFAPDLISKDGTKKEKGTGLGLKMALKFAELNGGKISVESKEGNGTTFSIYLPL